MEGLAGAVKAYGCMMLICGFVVCILLALAIWTGMFLFHHLHWVS